MTAKGSKKPMGGAKKPAKPAPAPKKAAPKPEPKKAGKGGRSSEEE
jgi:hypothetical protein